MPTFWAGWGGDLATLAREVKEYRLEKESEGVFLQDFELTIYAKKLMGGNSTFPVSDYHSDLDAIYIAEKLNDDQYLAETMEKYYLSGDYKNKSKKFAEYYIGDKPFNEQSLIEGIIATTNNLWEDIMWNILGGKEITMADKKAAINAFSAFVFKEIETN